MASPIIQTAFAAGELAPSLYGHVDIDKYAIGLSTARNGFISYRGGFYSRAGTAFAGFSKQTGRTVPPRIITFQFSINQGLALEFGNLYMRVISNGAFVTDLTKNITGITKANPGVFTSATHGFSNGDWVDLGSIGGMTQLNGVTGIIANATTSTFSLTDVYGTAINTTTFGAYTSGGTASRIYTLVTPYAEADLLYLKVTQSADVMSIGCVNQVTLTEYPTYDLRRLADDNWQLVQPTIGATVAAPAATSATAQPSTTISTFYSYQVTAIDAGTGEESIASVSANVENNDIAINAGSNIITWSAVPGANAYNIYKATPTYGQECPAGVPYGYMATAFGNQTPDNDITPDFSQVPPVHSNPFVRGAITDILPSAGGSNYSQSTIGYSISTSTGTGFVGTPIVANGSFAGFDIENPGKNYAPGDTVTITDSGGGVATGNFLGATNPSDGASVIVNTVQVKWRRTTTALGFNECYLGATLALSMQSMANFLNASNDPSLAVATFTYDSTHIYVTYKTPGTVGNAFLLNADTSGFTPSDATLTGGGTMGSGATATLSIGPETGTYPGVVGYYQQRRAYGYSLNAPDTYWMSQTGQYTNFDARIPPIPSDALTGTPWGVQVNGIQWFIPMPGGLVTLTGLSAWQLTGAGGSSLNPQAITPADQQAQPQAYNGASATVAPVRIDFEIIYLQALGSILRDLSYNFYTNIYTGVDITYLSSQLFTGYTIRDLCWTEEPFKLLWASRNDGTFLSQTFMKSQDVSAWARHDTYGQVWSLCSVTEPPTNALYMVTQRYPGGKNAYMIERMNDRIWPAREDCWCVDCGLSLPQPEPNATLTASSATGAGIPIGVVDLVGGDGYSSGTTADIIDPTGTGAAISLTIAAGVITGVNISGGTGYTYPVLVFTDPAGTGMGASATVTLDNSATFMASASVFSSGNVGSVIRIGGGIATITHFLGATTVTANIISPIVQTIPNSGGIPVPATSGNWTMTAPTSTITGLQHLAGATVTGLADGIVVTSRTVSATGTVALDAPASAVILGFGFTAQAQSLYLNTAQPTQQGQRKKMAAMTVRLEGSGVETIMAGANQPDGSALSPPQIAPAWSNLSTLRLQPGQNHGPYDNPVSPLYTGDTRVILTGGFAIPGQVAVQQSAPLPMQILAFVPEVLGGDTPAQKAPDRRQGRQEAA